MYCTKCGEKLKTEKKPVDSFDRRTGEQLYRVRAFCPHKRHFFSYHDEYRNYSYDDEQYLTIKEANYWMDKYEN
jgi:hypothetical protein